AFSAIDPDGAQARQIEMHPDEGAGAILSPDGQKLAWWTHIGDDLTRVAVCVRRVDGRGVNTRIDLPPRFKNGQGYIQFCWAPGGTELYVSIGVPGTRGVTHLRVDLNAK